MRRTAKGALIGAVITTTLGAVALEPITAWLDKEQRKQGKHPYPPMRWNEYALYYGFNGAVGCMLGALIGWNSHRRHP